MPGSDELKFAAEQQTTAEWRVSLKAYRTPAVE
jgi:hypothetical protein